MLRSLDDFDALMLFLGGRAHLRGFGRLACRSPRVMAILMLVVRRL